MVGSAPNAAVILLTHYKHYIFEKAQSRVTDEDSIAVLFKEELTPALRNHIRERMTERGICNRNRNRGYGSLYRQAFDTFTADHTYFLVV